MTIDDAIKELRINVTRYGRTAVVVPNLETQLAIAETARAAHALAVGFAVATGDEGGKAALHARATDPTTESVTARTQRISDLEYRVGAIRNNLDVARSERDAAYRQIHTVETVLGDEKKRHAVTQNGLDKFMSVCADQTIQIMELRGEIMRSREESIALAELRAKLQRIERTATPMESALATRVGKLGGELSDTERLIKKWDAQIDAVLGEAPREGETYADAAVRKIVELRDYIKELEKPCDDCKGLSNEIDRLTEISIAADGDRVPLAMENAELRSENARMKPLVEAAQKWAAVAPFGAPTKEPEGPGSLFSYEMPLIESVNDYEKACSASGR